MSDTTIETPPALSRTVSADLRKAPITANEARFLVDLYYITQENRIRAAGQVRAMGDAEPHTMLNWVLGANEDIEKQIKAGLHSYAKGERIGRYMLAIHGIGPVLAAGLLAHIDITMAPTVGHIWSFAGLIDGVKWEKGQKRPWNAQLKTLCWKIGESFVKVSGNEDAVYGQLYAERKAREIALNEAGEFAGQAERKLATTRIGKTTEAYKHYAAGRLPPAHVHARAKRFAVKIFLSHVHEVWRTMEGLEVVAPYPMAHLGHPHKIEPPDYPD